jgi:hypothetical protein
MKPGDRVRWVRKVDTYTGSRDDSHDCDVRFEYPDGTLLLELPEWLGHNLRYQRVSAGAVVYLGE